jgi:hypothetical protein
MLVRIVAMLTKLVEGFDPYQYRVRENAPSIAGPFEHEDDDEHEDDCQESKALVGHILARRQNLDP